MNSENKKIKIPIYSLVIHKIRHKLKLSVIDYVILDTIHRLTVNNEELRCCTLSKNEIATILNISLSTIHRAIIKGLKFGYLEKIEGRFLKTTSKWSNEAELFHVKL